MTLTALEKALETKLSSFRNSLTDEEKEPLKDIYQRHNLISAGDIVARDADIRRIVEGILPILPQELLDIYPDDFKKHNRPHLSSEIYDHKTKEQAENFIFYLIFATDINDAVSYTKAYKDAYYEGIFNHIKSYLELIKNKEEINKADKIKFTFLKDHPSVLKEKERKELGDLSKLKDEIESQDRQYPGLRIVAPELYEKLSPLNQTEIKEDNVFYIFSALNHAKLVTSFYGYSGPGFR